MFKDNEILDALHKLSIQIDTIAYELRSAKVDRVLAQAREKETQALQQKIIEKMGQTGYVGINAHIHTGDKMTPQQAAGVPDELPEWMIPIYQHFTGLIAVDVVDLVKKAAAGPASQWACGCPVAMPTHLAGCPRKMPQTYQGPMACTCPDPYSVMADCPYHKGKNNGK